MSYSRRVLDFWRGAGDPGVEHDEIVPLLWPALAWRVLAPEPQQDRLNLFQRAVLGACRAGRFTPEKLGAKLALHPKLIAVVLSELNGKGLIEAPGLEPTERGLALLEEEETRWEGARSGWMFQDEFSGRMLPCFADGLNRVIGDADEHQEFLLRRGANVMKPVVLLAPRASAHPSPEAIARALAAAKRRRRQSRFMDETLAQTDAAENSSSLPPTHLIELLDSRPERIFLLTAGRLSPEDYETTVDDPFGFGEDRVLWTELRNQAARQNPDQRIAIAVREIERLAERLRQPEMGTLQASIREQARRTVLTKLGVEIRQTRAVFEHLVRMEVSIAEAESDEDALHRLDTARNAARKALEALLKEIQNRDPDVPDLHLSLSVESGQDGSSILDCRARAMGFVGWPFKQALGKRDLKMLGARQRAGRSFDLQMGLIALLLRADRLPEHPLRRIAPKQPDFFELIQHVKNEGNVGSHDNESIDFPEADKVHDRVRVMRADCYRVVSLLLNLPLQTDTE